MISKNERICLQTEEKTGNCLKCKNVNKCQHGRK